MQKQGRRRTRLGRGARRRARRRRPEGEGVAAHQPVQPVGRVWKLSARNSARFGVSRVRGIGSAEERRAELDEQFAIRTAEDVAKELGEMKGVLMKAGQLISFIFEALPDEAQEALATLQADAAPMAPTLAANVVKGDFGKPPEKVFLDWPTCRSPQRRSARSTGRSPTTDATWRSRCSTRACTKRSRATSTPPR